MHWTVALSIAKNEEDVTFEEWVKLYVNRKAPTIKQIQRSCYTAHAILVRNHRIEKSVEFDQTIDKPEPRQRLIGY